MKKKIKHTDKEISIEFSLSPNPDEVTKSYLPHDAIVTILSEEENYSKVETIDINSNKRIGYVLNKYLVDLDKELG